MLSDQAQESLAITTDDLCIRNLKMWEIFDDLKSKYKHLKVTAFTIPKFKNLDSEDLTSPKLASQFHNWFEKRKDWVEIALHGFTHGHPPEFLRWKEYQINNINLALNALKSHLPKHVGLRPPGFQFNKFTEEACLATKLSYIATADQIISLKPMQKNQRFGLVNSHLVENQLDSLNCIESNLKELLERQNPCIFLSDLFV